MRLALELSAFNSLGGPHYRCRGEIAVLRGGRCADFGITLRDENDEPVAMAQLLAYPRWSEILEAFVARCVCKALDTRPVFARQVVRVVSLDVILAGETIRQFSATVPRGRLLVDGCPVLLPGGPACLQQEPLPLWQLIGLGLSFHAWGTVEVPGLPPVVDPRVRYHNGQTYCRLSDLPSEAQSLCERWLFGQPTPKVPDVEDAIFAQDMQRFLGA